MPAPVPSWNLVPVRGTWRAFDGSLKPGTYTVTYPRVTNLTDDAIIPAGTYALGALATTGTRSLDLMLPATNDADNVEQSFTVTITVSFADAAKETYSVALPVGGSVDLVTVLPSYSAIPMAQPQMKLGVPGGIAMLNSSGQVLDGSGTPVTGGGGGSLPVGGTTGQVLAKTSNADGAAGWTTLAAAPTWTTISGKPAVVAAGADAAAARSAIGAGTSSLAVGTTASDAKAGNWHEDWATLTGKPALAAVATSGSAADLSTGTLAAGRLPASLAFDVWQASGGAWPARPTVPTGARVNWIGYPGNTTAPSGATAGTDSYQPRPA